MYGKGPHAQVTCWKNRRVSLATGAKKNIFWDQMGFPGNWGKNENIQTSGLPLLFVSRSSPKKGHLWQRLPDAKKNQRPLRGAANVAFIGLSMACTGTFPSERVSQTSCFFRPRAKAHVFRPLENFKRKAKEERALQKEGEPGPSGAKRHSLWWLCASTGSLRGKRHSLWVVCVKFLYKKRKEHSATRNTPQKHSPQKKKNKKQQQHRHCAWSLFHPSKKKNRTKSRPTNTAPLIPCTLLKPLQKKEQPIPPPYPPTLTGHSPLAPFSPPPLPPYPPTPPSIGVIIKTRY